jgi:histidinol-phosphate aminotransferase
MTATPFYDKPPELYDGLRLHQNENTGGCSPAVIEALAKLRPDQLGFYPPYAAATAACAEYYGVAPDRITLTNGLDEGIMALAMAKLRPAVGEGAPEAIVPEPAFEIFRFDTLVAGGRLVQVLPQPDFVLPLDRVIDAITRETRLVFLTNPNNPTGVSMALDAIRAIAGRVPPEAIVFVDEAYAEFSGATFIPELPKFPNVVVGRTFSKAFGLAGIRAGCLIGAPETLEAVRYAIPVYSVNIAAVVAIQAALRDLAHTERYCREVRESKALLYSTCDRIGLRYWRSDANFVLMSVGHRTDALVRYAAERGIYIRDRSSEPGCEGCIRVAAGLVEHTRRFVSLMDDALCGAR